MSREELREFKGGKYMGGPAEEKAEKKMRGGGLARKGVGMALASGGLVKGAGCAQRGVKKARNV